MVHSVGILLERDYKSLAQSQSLCEVVNKLPGVFLNDHGNPLDSKFENTIRPTYEMMNRDTGKENKRKIVIIKAVFSL